MIGSNVIYELYEITTIPLESGIEIILFSTFKPKSLKIIVKNFVVHVEILKRYINLNFHIGVSRRYKQLPSIS